MKNYSYVGISLIILVFGIIFIPKIIDRIGSDEVVSSNRLNRKTSASSDASAGDLGYVVLNGEKRKAPQFELINQDRDTISNKDYEGKVYVVEFFFTTCPSICPIMNRNLIEVEEEFKDNDEFGIASFSIDPEHDTPEVLKKYAEDHNITDPDWHLLTGNRNEIYGLANGGFNIYAGEDDAVPGGFAHSGMFALVDQEGYIRSRDDKFGNPIIYYRGSVPRNTSVTEGEQEPQIDMLIKDIKKLL
ncbi:SCO family protein [Autumnicola musiva]|uniref:SCO family protein n=1 Tax=Autumnicola musiva TaxID=3075589 RepID=A0ABU3D0W5_9FLAO|nr:SCO family protein [Zunongwangia sp. F117]MDT0675051.1 SCO family protein [Zunongwangia sp. F117]